MAVLLHVFPEGWIECRAALLPSQLMFCLYFPLVLALIQGTAERRRGLKLKKLQRLGSRSLEGDFAGGSWKVAFCRKGRSSLLFRILWEVIAPPCVKAFIQFLLSKKSENKHGKEVGNLHRK